MKLSLRLIKHQEIDGVQGNEAIPPWIFNLGIRASSIVSFTALSFYPQRKSFLYQQGICVCHRNRLVGLEKISLDFSSSRNSRYLETVTYSYSLHRLTYTDDMYN